MKKRSKKVLSFAVAALMAVSSLPTSVMSVSAMSEEQSSNGGSAYNFLLKGTEDGATEMNVSAGDTKRVGVYLDTASDWPDNAWIQMVELNWVATKGAPLADGGEITSDIYFENLLNPSQASRKKVEYTINGKTLETRYPLWALAAVEDIGGELDLGDAKSQVAMRSTACDPVFGATLLDAGNNQIKFTYAYYASKQDKDAGTNQQSITQTCDVKTNENGVPYFTYTYVNQSTYQEETLDVEMPYYSPDRFITTSAGEAVPDANNFYLWQFKTSDSTGADRSHILTNDALGGKSTDYSLTEFDITVPAGTEDATYYVQLCTRDADGNIKPLATAADFADVKADQMAKGNALEDRSTYIGSSEKGNTYCLPQSADDVTVKIVVGEGGEVGGETTTSTTQATEETTTSSSVVDPNGKPTWDIDDVFTEAGATNVEIGVKLENGINSPSMQGTILLPEATRKVLLPPAKGIERAMEQGNAYLDLVTSAFNMKEYNTDSGHIYFGLSNDMFAIPENGEDIVTMTMNIADLDTVKAAAEAAGLELKTDENGKTYYEFPILWEEDGSDPAMSGDTLVDRARFQYLDENSLDVHAGNLVLETGSVNIYADDEPSEKTVWDIDDVFTEAGATNVEIGVKLENGINSPSMQGTILLPEATRKVLLPPAKGIERAMEQGNAYLDLVTSAFNMKEYNTDSGHIYFGLSNDMFAIPENGEDIVTMTMNIADLDTVKAAAEAAGLELKTDENGKTYYEFPILWEEDGSDPAMSGDTLVDRARFQYLDENSLDVHVARLSLVEGSVNIYAEGTETTTTEETTTTTTTAVEETTTTPEETTTTPEATTTTPEATTTTPEATTTTSAEATTTTAGTEATTATTASSKVELDGNSSWEIGTVWVKPGDGMGDEDVVLPISITNAIKSASLKGTLQFPDATKDLLLWPYNNPNTNPLFLMEGNDDDLSVYFGGTAALTGGVSDKTDYYSKYGRVQFALNDPNGLLIPEEANGGLAYGKIGIPDEDTVKAVAEEYGLTLQTGTYNGEEVTYYEFPINWADYATDDSDKAVSGDKVVTIERFQYMDENGTDRFQEYVKLVDGWVRVIVKETEETTTVSSEATTTSQDTTTTPADTTTTPADTTTTPADTTTTPADTTTTPADTTTTPADTTTTPADTTGTSATAGEMEVTLKDPGYYFSVDKNNFDPAELLTVMVDGVDVTADVEFEYATPEAMYNALKAPYVAQELKATYNGKELDKFPTVYIGIKGDTQLDGDVDLDDGFDTLTYYSKHAAGVECTLTDGKDAGLETLAYFLSDVDTESKEGKNTETSKLTLDDAFNIIQYYSYHAAGRDVSWTDVIPSLKELEGSIWYVG